MKSELITLFPLTKRVSLLLICILFSVINVKASSGNETVPYNENNMLSILSFDSIRPLTEINVAMQADAYPCISHNGLRLYYTYGYSILYAMSTERISVNSPWSTPVVLRSNMSPAGFTISANQLEMYYTSGSDVFRCVRPNVTFAFGMPLPFVINHPLNAAPVRSISFDPTGNMFIYVSDSTGYRLFELAYGGSNVYNFVHEHSLPAPYYSTNGRVSVDGLTFVLGVSDTTGNFNIGYMTRPALTDTFDTGTFTFIPELIDSTYYTTQPCLSQDNEWLAFARGDANDLTSTELYLAAKTGIISKVNEIGFSEVSLFPNPAHSVVNINLNHSANLKSEIEIFSCEGKSVYRNSAIKTDEVDVSGFSPGIYFYSIRNNNKTTTGKLVVN